MYRTYELERKVKLLRFFLATVPPKVNVREDGIMMSTDLSGHNASLAFCIR